MFLRSLITSALLAGLAVPALAQDAGADKPADATAAAAKPPKGHGEVAPKLADVEWLLGKPLKQFARGTTYVVCFWTPRDADSLRTLHVLEKLQKARAAERVAVVAIVVDDQPQIVPADGFVQRRKASLPFLVALDAMDKTGTAWAELLGGLRIPLAVIVDKAGRIAWRGNPLGTLDQALTAVLADDKATVDRLMNERRLLGEKFGPLASDLQKYYAASGMEKRCCEIVDQMVALDRAVAAPYLSSKYDLLRKQKLYPEAAAWGRLLVSELLSEDEVRLNELAWSIVDPKSRDTGGDIELAHLAAARANELAGGQDAAIMDTLARVLWYQDKGAEAVALETKAIDLCWSSELRNELQKSLVEFQSPRKVTEPLTAQPPANPPSAPTPPPPPPPAPGGG